MTFLEIFSSKKFSRVVVYCSVIKVPVVLLLSIVQLSRFLSFFFCDSFDILSNPFRFVKNFFYFSLFFAVLHKSALIYYHFCSHMSTIFYKFFHFFLGFHFATTYGSFTRYYPQWRKRDLNPRAGFPTYTLSRGASSAS